MAYTNQRAMLQGRTDGPQWMLYEAFFGPDLAMASSKDFALAYLGKDVETTTFEDLTADELVQVCEAIKGAVVVADDAAGTVTYNLNAAYALVPGADGGRLPGRHPGPGVDGRARRLGWRLRHLAELGRPAGRGHHALQQGQRHRPLQAGSLDAGRGDRPDGYRRLLADRADVGRRPRAAPARIKRVVIKNITEWGTRLSMLEAGDAD